VGTAYLHFGAVLPVSDAANCASPGCEGSARELIEEWETSGRLVMIPVSCVSAEGSIISPRVSYV
jgi:hypothetical protein